MNKNAQYSSVFDWYIQKNFEYIQKNFDYFKKNLTGQNFTQNQLTYNTKYTHNETIKVRKYYPYKIP